MKSSPDIEGKKLQVKMVVTLFKTRFHVSKDSEERDMKTCGQMVIEEPFIHIDFL